MTAALYNALLAQGAAVNLSARAKFRLTGSDRVRYLNGQVTNDVRRAARDETLYACVTDAKGRITADVFLHAAGDTLLLDAEPGLREALAMRLERYIVADDVELADVTEEWQLWHAWGENAEAGAPGGSRLRSSRFGVSGFDYWLPAAASPPDFGARPVLSADDLEAWRILQKVPRWPHELNGETFPPEAGLAEQAMDFAKGCYIGQEILSRIKTTGKMPRELIAFESDETVAAGDEIVSAKPVGVVTSVTRHPLSGKSIGLGMVRHGVAAEGGLRTAGGAALLLR